MNLYRELSKREEADFIQWAQDNYKAGDEIKAIWHPVVILECAKINYENYLMRRSEL